MENDEIRIRSIDQYVEVISSLYDKTERTLGREEILLFRGMKHFSYELKPSIARHPDSHIHNSLLWYEQSIVQEAKRKRPDTFTEDEYPMNLLTKLQHFGIPTRLLDITTNAFVALFFACEESDGDGEVVVFKIDKDNIYSNTSAIVNAISLSYKLGRLYSFDKLIKRAEKNRFFEGFDHDSVRDRFKTRDEYLEKLKQSYFNEPSVVFPLELSERQKRQQGAFFIFPNNDKDEINAINKHDNTIEKRIIIEVESKNKLSEQISFFGMTKEFLFPDSIDSLGETIRANVFQLYNNSGLGT